MKMLDNITITVHDLINRYSKGRVAVPPYQRNPGAWPEDDTRKFIKAVIAGNPIGAGKFHKVDDGKVEYQINDGLQRITTLRAYQQGTLKAADGKDLLAFKDLRSEDQDAFENHPFTVEVFTGTLEEAEKLFQEANNVSASKLTKGNILHSMTSYPASQVLRDLAGHKLFEKTNTKKHQNYEFAAALLLNAGEILPDDTRNTIQTAFMELSQADADARKHLLDVSLDSAFEVSQVLGDRGAELPKSRKHTLMCQLAIAILRQPRLTTQGADLLAGVCLEPKVIRPEDSGKRSGHPLNFSSPNTKTVLARFATTTQDSRIFRDKRRAATPDIQSAVDTKQTVNGVVVCAGCEEPILPEEEREYDHVEEYADGGKTVVANLRALHKRCHRTPAYRATIEKGY
jgi:hypothetical protein